MVIVYELADESDTCSTWTNFSPIKLLLIKDCKDVLFVCSREDNPLWTRLLLGMYPALFGTGGEKMEKVSHLLRVRSQE